MIAKKIKMPQSRNPAIAQLRDFAKLSMGNY
jgi:hypothetical protein